MNLRWLWLDHFPPGMELTQPQREEARRRAREHRLKDQSYRGSAKAARNIAFVTSAILSTLFVLWLLWIIRWQQRSAMYHVLHILSILVFQGLIWVGISLAMNRSRGPYIRKALNDMDLPVCMECGYILRGIHEKDSCPECGTARDQCASTPSDMRT